MLHFSPRNTPSGPPILSATESIELETLLLRVVEARSRSFPSFLLFLSLSLSYFLLHRYSYNETAINEARPGAPAISSIRVTSMGERRGRGEEEDRF